ncbi:MAG: hypothetical protein Q7S26_00225 [bacterium]|nr:hypothetical protein [bacterium]
MVAPKIPVPEGGRILGTVDEPLRRVYALAAQTALASDQAAVNAEHSIDKEEEDALRRQAIMLRIKHNILRRVFMASVRDQFNYWENDLQMCKDWQAVVIERSTESSTEEGPEQPARRGFISTVTSIWS